MKTEKRQGIYKAIMLVIITAMITFLLTTMLMYKKLGATGSIADAITSNNTKEQQLISTLQRLKNILEQKYIGEIDENDLIEGAIAGYIAGLGDPYTQYLPKTSMDEIIEEANGKYVGIGVYIGNNTIDNTIVVASVIENTPASKAGLQAGDVIFSIEGKEYKGEELSKASAELKGEEGTTTKIVVIREGNKIEFNVTRERIHVSKVSEEFLENNIGYLKIDAFDGGVAKEAEEKLKKLIDKGMKSLIIDLRSNGGGIVEEATEIGELFTNKEDILLITKSKDKEDVILKSQKDPIIKDMPVIVLTNGTTASASEILAGILRDNIGAKLVGTKTYGKGVIQTVYRLNDGSGIKVTTDEYYTPKHNQINKIGLEPDAIVNLTKDAEGNWETEREKDAQLKKALELLK